MEEKNKLFRQKSLDIATAPDEIDGYIKTVKPSIWIILIAVAVFLLGVLVWASLTTIDTTIKGHCEVSNGQAVFYISEENFKKVQEDSKLVIKDKNYNLTSVIGPVQAEDDSSALHAGGIKANDWYYMLCAKTDMPDGGYDSYILVESITPIDFILN